MLCTEPGVLPGSDRYCFMPSNDILNLHYCMTMCGHYRCTSGYQVKRPFYNALLIAYVQSGTFHLEYQGQSYTAHAKDVVVLDCQYPHRYFSGENLEFIWAHMDGCNAHALCKDINDHFGVVLSHPYASFIEDELYNLVSACRRNQALSVPITSGILHNILCHLYPPEKKVFEIQKIEPAIGAVITYLNFNLNNPITVEDMAKVANLSRYHFSRRFKQATGFAPHDYLVHLRLEHARYLLKTTDKTVQEIAYEAGFKSGAGFIKCFIDKMGISPGKFRIAQAQFQDGTALKIPI